MELSSATRDTAAVLLLSLVAVEWGGTYVLRLVRGGGSPTAFQVSFARAGHAHAGVLLTLALVIQLLADGAGLGGVPGILARSGVPAAAILMPLGFFLSSMGRERTRPNRFVWLIYAGGAVLAAGVVTLGIGLLGSQGG